MRTRIIYGLSDPRQPGAIRYVGKSTASAERRLFYHIKEAKSEQRKKVYKNCWIRKLLKSGVAPTITIIETLLASSTAQDHNNREIYWISEMRKRGHRLTNLATGGDGGSAIGVPKTETCKRTISNSLLGHQISAETRSKISASLTGKPCSSKTRFKKGATPWNKGKQGYKVARRKGIGWHQTTTARRRISEAATRQWTAWRLNRTSKQTRW